MKDSPVPVQPIPLNAAVHQFDLVEILNFLERSGVIKLPDWAQIHGAEIVLGHSIEVVISPGVGEVPPGGSLPCIRHHIENVADQIENSFAELLSRCDGKPLDGLGPDWRRLADRHRTDTDSALAEMGYDFKKEQEAIRAEERFRQEQLTKTDKQTEHSPEMIARMQASASGVPLAQPADPQQTLSDRVKAVYDKAHADVEKIRVTSVGIIFDRDDGSRLCLPVVPGEDTYESALDRAAAFNLALWYLTRTECVRLVDTLKARFGYLSKSGDFAFQHLMNDIPLDPKPTV